MKEQLSGNVSVANLLADCGVTKVGWVLRGGTLLWKRRYLVVKQDESKLYYFASDLDPAPKLEIGLSSGVSVQPAVGKKGHSCFSVISPDSRITFACQTSEERDSWIQALNEAGSDGNDEQAETDKTLWDYSATDIDGNIVSLAEHKGKVCLIVNVASR